MTHWWETLVLFEKILWFIAIPFSLILIIQMIMTFAGMGGHDTDVGPGEISGSVDVAEIDQNLVQGDSYFESVTGPELEVSFNFFTVRNFIAFFTMFGWSGIAAYNNGASYFITIIIAVAGGLFAMVIISALFYFVLKLQDTGGGLNIRNAINQIGSVYLPIEANSGNVGKIQLHFQGALRELNAITRGNINLPTGTVVKVTGLASNQIVVVEKNEN